MSEIRTHAKARLTEWRIDYTGGEVALEMRFDNSAVVLLDTEAVGQLVEITPQLELHYQRAMLTKMDMPSNPLLAG